MKANQVQVSTPLRIGNERVSTHEPLSQLMSAVMSQVGARRSAAQSRSQDKMERVLQATAALLDESGAEAESFGPYCPPFQPFGSHHACCVFSQPSRN